MQPVFVDYYVHIDVMNRKEYLGKYLLGTASQQEKEQITAWITGLMERVATGQANEEEEEIIAHWLSHEREISINPEEVEKRKKATKMILDAQQLTELRKEKRSTFYRYAAAIIILFILGTGTYYIYHSNDKTMEATLYFPTADHVKNNIISYQVRPGNTAKKVQLPDSSFVYLNSNASLSLDSGTFNARNREVILDNGEAFFEVAKNVQKKFTVQFGSLFLEVIGTSFNIENDELRKVQRVFVKTGKVLIKENGKLIASLTPGEIFTYNNKTKDYAVRRKNNIDLSEWTSGKLIFESADWSEIKQKIENRFNIELVIENNVIPATIELNAVFGKEDSYSEIAKVIAGIYDARFRIQENKMIFFR